MGKILKAGNNSKQIHLRSFSMSQILSVGTSVPPYEITQSSARDFSKYLFENHFKDIDRLLKIFENTQIKKRHFCVPIEWFGEHHTIEEKNAIYVKNAIELSKQAIISALSATAFNAEDINHIFFISSTGFSTPSIDAFLFNDPELDFKSNIKRTPIWGLGCSGGAAGLSRAFEYTRAFPKEIALVIAVEIGEMAFLKDDYSKSNLIATSLFGDGAAAVLVAGKEVDISNDKNKLTILNSQSAIWEDSLDVMGWDVKNEGLKVIFSKSIPSIVSKDVKPDVEIFLKNHNLSLNDLNFFILHPGGAKIIQAYEKEFQISEEKLNDTKKILYEYGNMSSPTVLFVLKEFLEGNLQETGYGILLSLGPGFSSEMLLLKHG